MDNLTSTARSSLMSRVRRENTLPELIVRNYLFMNGLRYRVNNKRLPGSPDVVLRKYMTVVFIHGCFWHGHKKCRAAKIPATNSAYWKEKINGNIGRDRRKEELLRGHGWNIEIVWECDLKSIEKRNLVLVSLVKRIRSRL